MRKSTVKLGLNCIIAAIVSVTLASYFHQEIARLFFLSGEAEARFVFFGLFWGGILGGIGVIIVTFGFLRTPSIEHNVQLTPTILVLIAVSILFFVLFISFFKSPEPTHVRPGETITV
jgi:H+/Cl- antiporter ClcA